MQNLAIHTSSVNHKNTNKTHTQKELHRFFYKSELLVSYKDIREAAIFYPMFMRKLGLRTHSAYTRAILDHIMYRMAGSKINDITHKDITSAVWITNEEIAEKIGCSLSSCKTILRQLEQAGIIKRYAQVAASLFPGRKTRVRTLAFTPKTILAIIDAIELAYSNSKKTKPTFTIPDELYGKYDVPCVPDVPDKPDEPVDKPPTGQTYGCKDLNPEGVKDNPRTGLNETDPLLYNYEPINKDNNKGDKQEPPQYKINHIDLCKLYIDPFARKKHGAMFFKINAAMKEAASQYGVDELEEALSWAYEYNPRMYIDSLHDGLRRDLIIDWIHFIVSEVKRLTT